MRIFGFILVFSFFALGGYSQSINWIDIEEVSQKVSENPKPVMVFVYTDWCKYCAFQKQTSFQDSAIVNQLNKEYYCVKLNGELKKDVKFLGRTYHYNTEQKEHELVAFLATENGKVSYPTTLFFDKQFNLQKREANYLPIRYFRAVFNKAKP